MNNDSSSRLAAELRNWVAAAAPGARLPGSRSLVAQYQVSPVTVQKALRLLARDGLVEARPGVGTFVRVQRSARAIDHGWQTRALRDRPHRIARDPAALRTASPHQIALHAGYPDRELLPERLVRQALTRAARAEAAVLRAPSAGLPELQSWFAQELAVATGANGVPPTGADVLITPGSQSGLASIFRCLVAPGEPLLMEAPSYWGAIQAAQRAGARIVPVATGPAGPDPDDLDRAFAETGASLFYAQPNYANPTGAQWSTERQADVLAVVRRHHAFVVEDDWAHDFAITSTPRPMIAEDSDGHVIYLRSLTKSVSPAIRVAAIVARGPVRARIAADRDAESMYVSPVLQAAALEVVTHPGWQTHLRRVREALAERRDLLVGALATHAPTAQLTQLPAGGLNVWVQLPPHTSARQVAAECETHGLLIAAGEEWFPAEATGPFVRLNFSGPHPAAYPKAAQILGQVLAGLR